MVGSSGGTVLFVVSWLVVLGYSDVLLAKVSFKFGSLVVFSAWLVVWGNEGSVAGIAGAAGVAGEKSKLLFTDYKFIKMGKVDHWL